GLRGLEGRQEHPRTHQALSAAHLPCAPPPATTAKDATMTVTETSPHVSENPFPTGRLFIGGQWRDATGSGLMAVEAPATGEKLTDVARATIADVDAAVTAARAAFDSGVWSGLPGRERARI